MSTFNGLLLIYFSNSKSGNNLDIKLEGHFMFFMVVEELGNIIDPCRVGSDYSQPN